MKSFKFILLFLLFAIENSDTPAQYSGNAGNFYFGVGTGVYSYLGGYFGNAYSLRVLSDYSDDYYYENYYSSSYYGSYNDYTLWSPIAFDVTAGYNINENLSAEFSSTFVFAFNGRLDPEFVTGTRGNRDFIDRNGYSQLYAVPLSATLNIHSADEYGSGVFFKIGPALQYTSEEYDRIREYYDYDKYYSYSSYVYLYTVSKSEWLPGFTASTGLQFTLSENVLSYTELAYSYFKISPNNSTALAIDRAKEAQLFSLNTKIFFSF